MSDIKRNKNLHSPPLSGSLTCKRSHISCSRWYECIFCSYCLWGCCSKL